MKKKLFLVAALVLVGSAAALFLVASPNVPSNGSEESSLFGNEADASLSGKSRFGLSVRMWH